MYLDQPNGLQTVADTRNFSASMPKIKPDTFKNLSCRSENGDGEACSQSARAHAKLQDPGLELGDRYLINVLVMFT